MSEEKKINEKFNEFFSKFSKQVNGTLNILVIGKVSTGKSSFLNAFFDAEKDKPKFKVGAKSGETTKVQKTTIGKNINIIDTPGLSDINTDNSQETKNFIEEEGIDIGILIISGSADSSHNKQYEYLKQHASKVFIVLNKADTFSNENLEEIIQQWKEQLSLAQDEKIYPVVSRGYDPKDKEVFRGEEYTIEVDQYGRPKLLQGIDNIRDDVLKYLEVNGKDLILSKELKDKNKKATMIISTACASAATAAFAPGSALYIGAIQATAIASLSYLYTGNILSKSSAISTAGIFVAENIGTSIFLLAKSFLPPSGILDITASAIALSITAAMLTAISKLYSNGYSLEDKDILLNIFDDIKNIIETDLKNANKSDLLNKDFYIKLISKILTNKV